MSLPMWRAHGLFVLERRLHHRACRAQPVNVHPSLLSSVASGSLKGVGGVIPCILGILGILSIYFR